MEPVQVAAVQLHAGDDAVANRDRLLALVAAAVGRGARLVVCPEAAMRGFGRPDQPLAPVAEPLDGPFVRALAGALAGTGATVLAGMFESAGPDRAYNTVVALDRTGLVGCYRKLHLFDAHGWVESDRLATVALGPEALLVVEVAGLRVGVMTCYDLRFPELARALVDAGATVLAVPAAWVAGPGKEDQWRVLLRARAVENAVWVLAAGQPAPEYCGLSMLVDPAGVVTACQGSGEGVLAAEIDPAAVERMRRVVPALEHRRFAVVPRG